MATKSAARKSQKVKKEKYIRTEFRFKDVEHYNLIAEAVNKSGLSMNSWLIQATSKQARLDLKD